MTTTDLTAATPVEIDTALSEIYERYYTEKTAIERLSGYVEDMERGLAKKAETGSPRYSAYTEEALADLWKRIDTHLAAADSIMAETAPYDAEFNRRPWSRFFLVQNNGGHIHSSMSCSTCNKGLSLTRFGWLPNLSGLSEPDAVKAHGAILCTVCYPSAPTEWTDRHDDSVCTGSGQYYDSSLPSRTGYYSGNWGTCTGCGEKITISKTGKIRKHKKA